MRLPGVASCADVLLPKLLLQTKKNNQSFSTSSQPLGHQGLNSWSKVEPLSGVSTTRWINMQQLKSTQFGVPRDHQYVFTSCVLGCRLSEIAVYIETPVHMEIIPKHYWITYSVTFKITTRLLFASRVLGWRPCSTFKSCAPCCVSNQESNEWKQANFS